MPSLSLEAWKAALGSLERAIAQRPWPWLLVKRERFIEIIGEIETNG